MKSRMTYIRNILLPCFVFSLMTGVLTGCLIFLFELASTFVMRSSVQIYDYVRAHPMWLPCLVGGVAIVGLIAALILRGAKNCRGGGIPTTVAILRGLIEFKWLKSIFFLFASALLTFLGGVPLGNEGPSVQMGTAVGRGTVGMFGKKNKAWDRYIMTGGACGGFAAATGAPLAGIFFAFEEAHRRFSPILFMTAAISVTSATAVKKLLSQLLGVESHGFGIPSNEVLPLKYLWTAVAVGLICGLLAVGFTALYSVIDKFMNKTLERMPFTLKIVLVFALVALCGFASGGLIGSGKDIIVGLVSGEGIWYLMLIYLCVRALFLILANRSGVSGGIFIPTLTFGALAGALFARIAVSIGALPSEYFVIVVVMGMASFLSASARTPIVAVTFSLEVLSGLANILPIALGVTVSFLVIEAFGVISLQDIVIHKKVEAFNEGHSSSEVDCSVTVMENSFAVGKEVRDILWPPTCTVLSVDKPHDSSSAHRAGVIDKGDILHIHYKTYDQERSFEIIESIVGDQPDDQRIEMRPLNEKNQVIPDN